MNINPQAPTQMHLTIKTASHSRPQRPTANMLGEISVRIAAFLLVACLSLHSSNAQSTNRVTPVVKAIASSKASVVDIEGKKMVRNDSLNGDPGKAFKQVKGMGTGVIVDPRGYILTNYHVVDGVSRIQVRMSDETETIARMIAHDARTDLAIIKIDLQRKLPVIRIGTSSDLMEGETVIAMGNAYGYRHSSTLGIVSALHRNVPVSDSQVYYDLIQIDAPINPGNSGGPLLNIDGELIGINAAVRVGAQCIAFTIPINSALETAADLINVESREKLSLGFTAATVYKDHQPQLVVRSVTDSKSLKLRNGDVVESVNGQPVKRRLDLERSLIGLRSGQEVELAVNRDGEQLLATVSLKSSRAGVSPAVDNRIESPAWEMLGLELETIPNEEFDKITTEHNGGMRVIKVRANGPAAARNIRTGDVLIGIHEWETTCQNDVEFILNQDEIRQQSKVKYYIVRGKTTLWGVIHVASRTPDANQK